MLNHLLKIWLQNAAKQRIRDAVVQVAKEQLSAAATPSKTAPSNTPPAAVPTDTAKTCHVGFVFALDIESGCLEDLLQGSVTIRGNGFVARECGLNGRRVVIMLAGPGRENARRATEVLIDGHRPNRVISAGFAGALSPSLKRNDILLADRLLCETGGTVSEISVELATDATSTGATAGLSSSARLESPQYTAGQASSGAQNTNSPLSQLAPGVYRGTLLTTDQIVRLPSQRKSLFERFGAAAVDMETFAVAEVCRRRQTPFSSVRVINDLADETLPPDMEHVMSQHSLAGQFGAALGAVWRRPASAKDMYQLRENALVASGELAKFLKRLAW